MELTYKSPKTRSTASPEKVAVGKLLCLRFFLPILSFLRVFEGKVYYYVNGKYIDTLLLTEREKRELRWSYISYIPQGSMSAFNPVKKS